MDFNKLTELLNKLTNKKNMSNIIILFLAGVLLLIVCDFFKGSSKEYNADTNAAKTAATASISGSSDLDASETKLESELKNILSGIKGVGKVDVMIHFSSGEETVPAINSQNGKSTTTETDNQGGKRETTQNNESTTVVMNSDNGENKPVITKKMTPAISGIVIVAQGADDADVKDDITSAVSSLFGIPNYEVSVFSMN
ncbi:stage III sporulation protein AG [Clostridium sp. 19966]|uniref:stage III sporulation protein AG n=1 Tax=Clostridium sp. 19966 TaxID=2768166 RepID=UPI0028DE0314|nr:stage III sporulation protein AG [Clostridium sp. 19966]MDT8716583.1 stage III sporulation protein AG [Clostridium sp. 19966]